MCGTPLLPDFTLECVCVDGEKRLWLPPGEEEAKHMCLKHPS